MPFIKTGPDDFEMEIVSMYKTPDGALFDKKSTAAAHMAKKELSSRMNLNQGLSTFEIEEVLESIKSDGQFTILAMIYLSDGNLNLDFQAPKSVPPGQEIAFREIKVNVNK